MGGEESTWFRKHPGDPVRLAPKGKREAIASLGALTNRISVSEELLHGNI